MEAMLGHVGAESTIEGTLNVPILPDLVFPSARIKIGVAVDAIAANLEPEPIIIEITKGEKPVIDARVSLINENGGHISGVIEANEEADLEFTLSNNGLIDARNIKVAVANLSGTQVEMQDKINEIGMVKVGGVRSTRFRIKASKTLISDKIDVGLSVACEGLVAPLYYHFVVDGHSNMDRDRYSKLFGH